MKSKAWIIAAPFSGSFFELYLPTSDERREREPVCACPSHRCHPERTRRRRRTEADLLPSVPNGATAEPQPTPYISTRDVISFLSWSSGAGARDGLNSVNTVFGVSLHDYMLLTPCLRGRGSFRGLNLVSVSCSFAPFSCGIMYSAVSLWWDDGRATIVGFIEKRPGRRAL